MLMIDERNREDFKWHQSHPIVVACIKTCLCCLLWRMDTSLVITSVVLGTRE